MVSVVRTGNDKSQKLGVHSPLLREVLFWLFGTCYLLRDYWGVQTEGEINQLVSSLCKGFIIRVAFE